MDITTQNINHDIYAVTPVKIHVTRSCIYKRSPVILDKTDGEVIEISGYLSLEDKFALWSKHGQPIEFLYFSITDGTVCMLSDITNDANSINWCIGWISEDRAAFIFVDMINLLIDYYYQCQARSLSNVPIQLAPNEAAVL